jgi:hypothetical protein
MNDNEDPIDPKFKKIAINLDDFEEEAEQGDKVEGTGDDEPTLTLGLEARLTSGRQIRFAKEFSLDALDDYILLQNEDEEHFRHASEWINILGLAGAKTFANPDEQTLFADPQGSWIDLYFAKLPDAISSYGDMVWASYTSIDLWLKDTRSGEVMKKLRLVAPADDDAEPAP